jgi:hypothetical protein
MNAIPAAVAVAFLAMGVMALVRPRSIGKCFDVKFDSVDGRNEVRAVYGGFGLAMTLALVLALTNPVLRPGICACVSLALAGMAAGRLFGAAIETPGRWPWIYFGIETTCAAALAWTLV